MKQYTSLRECALDLEANGKLIRVTEEIDPDQEMAEIHRRVFDAQGPALWFTKVKGSKFSALSNLFGTRDRIEFLFRHTIDPVRKIFELKADPKFLLKSPLSLLGLPGALTNALPKQVATGPVLHNRCQLTELPNLKCWPKDGGGFLTLPQVMTQDITNPGLAKSNLGMYRIQISGGKYLPNEEAGMHYQIHRGIGIHHHAALQAGQELPVSIFLGGPPAHTFSSVMPMPEGIPEVYFAGLLAGRRFRYKNIGPWTISTDADFCILGTISLKNFKPEGPFGDHLGYYSLEHDFPVLQIKAVYHRQDAIFPFTVVGRPPQEDTFFGEFIHELTAPVVPASLPGVKRVNAVDAAGVHPLMLAIGSERYVPYEERRPMELMTLGNAILGFGQMSLSKYLCLVAGEDNPELDCRNIQKYFEHLLERVDWRKDLHFQTETTIDTLDYSGHGLNKGSKVLMVAAGKSIRKLGKRLPDELKGNNGFPTDFSNPKVIMPGVLAFQSTSYEKPMEARKQVKEFCSFYKDASWQNKYPLIVLVDDSRFCAASLDNWLWVTFTRSNPATDVAGIQSFIKNKHWGCRGSLVIDARLKPGHAPVLEPDSNAVKRAEALAAPGGSLHGIY